MRVQYRDGAQIDDVDNRGRDSPEVVGHGRRIVDLAEIERKAALELQRDRMRRRCRWGVRRRRNDHRRGVLGREAVEGDS